MKYDNKNALGREKKPNTTSRRMLAAGLAVGMLVAGITYNKGEDVTASVTDQESNQPQVNSQELIPSIIGNGETSLVSPKGGNYLKVSKETNEYVTDHRRNDAILKFKKNVAMGVLNNFEQFNVKVTDIDTGKEVRKSHAGYVWVSSTIPGGAGIGFQIMMDNKFVFNDIPELIGGSGGSNNESRTDFDISTVKGVQIVKANRFTPSEGQGLSLQGPSPSQPTLESFDSEYPSGGLNANKYEQALFDTLISPDITRVYDSAGVTDYPVAVNIPTIQS